MGVSFIAYVRFIASRAPSAAGHKFRGTPAPPARRAIVPRRDLSAIANAVPPPFLESPRERLRPTALGSDPGPQRCAAAAPAALRRGVRLRRAPEIPDGLPAASTCDGSGTSWRSPAAPTPRNPPEPN